MDGVAPSCAGTKPMNHECGGDARAKLGRAGLARRVDPGDAEVADRAGAGVQAAQVALNRVDHGASYLAGRRLVDRPATAATAVGFQHAVSGPAVGSPAWARTSRTTYGCGVTPPLAIVAASSAICTGVTWTRPCPNAACASSARSWNEAQSPFTAAVTCEAATGRPRAPARPPPAGRRSRIAARTPGRGPSRAQARRAQRRCCSRPAAPARAATARAATLPRSCSMHAEALHHEPVALLLRLVRERRLRRDGPGVQRRGGGQHLHDRAGRVLALPARARRAGCSGCAVMAAIASAAVAGSPEIGVGSKVGVETMARMAPRAGSMRHDGTRDRRRAARPRNPADAGRWSA